MTIFIRETDPSIVGIPKKFINYLHVHAPSGGRVDVRTHPIWSVFHSASLLILFVRQRFEFSRQYRWTTVSCAHGFISTGIKPRTSRTPRPPSENHHSTSIRRRTSSVLSVSFERSNLWRNNNCGLSLLLLEYRPVMDEISATTSVHSSSSLSNTNIISR